MVVTNDDMVAGALFDFAAWLTTREATLIVGASHESSAIVPVVQDFLKARGLEKAKPFVSGWEIMLVADRKDKE